MKSISGFSRKINRKRCQLGDPSAGVGLVESYSQFPSTFSLKMSCFQNDLVVNKGNFPQTTSARLWWNRVKDFGVVRSLSEF